MDVPFELILPPLVLAGVWFYWRSQNRKRKSDMLSGHQDVMEKQEMQELLSTEGKRLAKREGCEKFRVSVLTLQQPKAPI